MKTKIIAGILLGTLLISSAFAYDLTDKEKTKGDTITSKIMMIINKKPEEKQEKLTKSVITQLETLQERARKNEKMAALIGYVAEKMKLGTETSVKTNVTTTEVKETEISNAQTTTTASRYPGCDTDNIKLSNGQVWAACNVGSDLASKIGKNFTWGNITGYTSQDIYSRKTSTSGYQNDWNENKPQGPCANYYHIPTETEFESALTATKNENGGIVMALGTKKIDDWTNLDYWTSTESKDYKTSAFLLSNLQIGLYPKNHYGNIRCIKD